MISSKVLLGALCLLAGFLFWLPSTPAGAVIYRYVDENGVMHFTNTPADSRYQPMDPPASSWRSGADPPAAARYDPFIRESAHRFGVDPLLVKAVIKAESYFDSRAVSRKGAQGLMQLMPETARELMVRNPFDPGENIRGGTQYLRRMLDLFQEDLQLALAAYNAGPTRVQALGRVPRIAETEQYVERVLFHYRRYQTSASHANWVSVNYE